MLTVVLVALLQAKVAMMQRPSVGVDPGSLPQISAPQTGGASRLQQCDTHCTAVDGKPVYTKTCHDLIPAPAAAGGGPRLRADRGAPATAVQSRAADAPAAAARPRVTSMAPGTTTRQLADAGRLAAVRVPANRLQGLVCGAHVRMALVRAKSPNCWIPDGRYCTYAPAGLIGYSCSCGGHSGQFG